jgi:hypothetical protein
MLQFSKACLLLVTFLLPIAFPAWAETYPDERPQVVVSVYNDAGISATVLVQAEQEAAKIFDRAGLDVAWQNCAPSRDRVGPDALVGAGERSSPGSESDQAGLRPAGRVGAPAPTRFGLETLGCASFEWPTRLAVRVVPQSRLSTNEVFGVAFLSAEGTGCYSDVFYDRAMELHANWNVDLADILGNVMAHELGHLLLGSNSHASMGIMRAHWQGEDLRRLSRGNLLFTNEQADQMRGKVTAIQPGKSTEMAASTQSAF